MTFSVPTLEETVTLVIKMLHSIFSPVYFLEGVSFQCLVFFAPRI